jgi:hypothetical protein
MNWEYEAPPANISQNLSLLFLLRFAEQCTLQQGDDLGT